MPIILPEDDIPASGEISISSRLGLPKIPRANNQALSAINAITRILDAAILNRTGDVSAGEFSFTGKVSVAELEATAANIVTAVINSANVGVLSVDNARISSLVSGILSAENGTISALSSDSSLIKKLTATIATVSTLDCQTIQARTLEASKINTDELESKDIKTESIYTMSAEVDELQAGIATFRSLQVENGSYQVSKYEVGTIQDEGEGLASGEIYPSNFLNYHPDIIEYSLYIKSTPECFIQGTVNVDGTGSSFAVLEIGDLITPFRTGLGFPQHNGADLFTVTFEDNKVYLKSSVDFDATVYSDYEFTYRAIRYPIPL